MPQPQPQSQIQPQPRPRPFALLLLLSLAFTFTLTLVACGTQGPGANNSGNTNEPFRFAVVSDTHVIANPSDANNQRLARMGATFAGFEPGLDFVVSTGDNIDDLYCFPGLGCEDPLPILEQYLDLIQTAYPMPFYVVLGNHDVRYFDTFQDLATPRASWAAVFGSTDHLPAPYYAVRHKGFLFLMLDGGELATDHASNDVASFGGVRPHRRLGDGGQRERDRLPRALTLRSGRLVAMLVWLAPPRGG